PEIPHRKFPVDAGVPIERNQASPRFTMKGTLWIVSTLLTVVGEPHSPKPAGNGGFGRGWPRFPSRLSMSPVSSPQMYAPAPWCGWISQEKAVPRILAPIRFAARASAIAAARRAYDLRYSPRTYTYAAPTRIA